ncbi:MAG: FecR domain-containing protein [Acidobacteriales bacterium]|nr:FecR domain-containing protein [Terriglobales bacterium]
MSSKRKPEFHIGWTTITYRSVFTAVLLLLIAIGIFMYFVFPGPTNTVMAKASTSIRGWLDKFAKTDGAQPPLPPQQAHFTNLDGTVRVKKATSNTWVKADYGLPLEKGDIVQTMSEGIAKVAFADGSTYSIQQDSLVTIEESTTNAQQVPQVAVRLDTGEIHLNTGAVPSRQQVRIDNSTTTVAPDSALLALNDRRHDKRQVMVTKGSAQFAMGTEVVAVAPYERVAFNPETGKIAKEKEIAPPVLLAPANMMPIFNTATGKSVDFSWTPVDNAKFYKLRISRNPYFSSIEKEVRANTPETKVSGLSEGRYYWVVQSVDSRGKESVESERSGFTLITRGSESEALLLEMEPFVQHGHVIQVKGKTERGARVMVNGEEVPVIAPDGSFSYFTPPLPSGESIITVTAQNSRGGVSTQTKRVLIQ